MQLHRHAHPGTFILIEGPDRAGKTTAVQTLGEILRGAGHAVCTTKEPQKGNIFGDTVRAMYQFQEWGDIRDAIVRCTTTSEWDPERFPKEAEKYFGEFLQAGEALLSDQSIHSRNILFSKVMYHVFVQLGMIFDRRLHYRNVILPRLGSGEIVISDRSFPSTLVYGMANGLTMTYLVDAHRAIVGDDLISPDLMFFFDVSAGEAFRRKILEGGTLDAFESRGQIAKTAAMYRHFHEEFPFATVIDANQSPAKIVADIMQDVQVYFSSAPQNRKA